MSIAITGAEQATSTAPGCSSGGCKEFLFSPSGSILAVVQNGALVKGTLPLPGGDTAIYNASGLSYLRHNDYLNSSRLATTWAHAVYSKVAFAPFGETYNEAGTPDRSFTGQDQDVVAGSAGSGVYDFLFRKYDPSAGRWLSPDPSGWNAVSLTAPQSFNRYAYVQNNPMQAVDPTGLDCLYLNTDGSVTVGGNYDCPTDAHGNPTDNGVFVDATGVTGGQFDTNGNLLAFTTYLPWTGDSITVSTVGPLAPAWLGMSLGDGQVAVHGIWTYGNFCGKGGVGTAIDPTDAACQTHDNCYNGINLTADQYTSGNLTPGQVQGAARCNQQLCNAVLNVNRTPGIPFSQRFAGAEIILFFSLTGPKEAQCHGV